MKRISALELRDKKTRGERIVVSTAYDATFTRLIDPHVDAILVGDSVGMVVQGHDHTLQVTVEHMVYHCASVARSSRQAHLIGDLPFMSYQVSPSQGVESAGRLVQSGSVQSVKLEGGRAVTATVEKICEAGIPVMGHLGLTPQSVHSLGGFRVQGRGPKAEARLLEDALALENAGVYALVLEMVPAEVAATISDALEIPTIGIGAGSQCDGQVLVSYDMLGLNPDFKPRFVKQYAELAEPIQDAMRAYADDVRAGRFPDKEHSYRQTALEVIKSDGPALDSKTPTGKHGP